MSERILHITNGSSLTNYLQELDFNDDILTWHEMLCEGNTTSSVSSKSFLNQRKAFLNTYYDIEIDEYEFKSELAILDNVSDYTQIILWFEYDLFCHINLLAIISLLKEKNISLPLYLVCSGHVEGDRNLKGLSELNHEQLLTHYENKIQLTDTDIDLAITIWRIYCGKDHNLLKLFYEKYQSLELTEKGSKMALNVVRKHRLWEALLYKLFDMSLHEIHREAELLEHQTSDFLANKISSYLGNPKFDPHGDPIPNEHGDITTDDNSIPLSKTHAGKSYFISRLMSDDKEFFDFCALHGLKYGNRIMVTNQFQNNKMTQISINYNTILLNEDFTNIIYVNEIN